MTNFNIGYLFKPSHDEIHYLKKGANGDLRKKYNNNFTRDIALATVIEDEVKGKQFITKLVAKFGLDDEYNWTPVLVNADNKTFKRYLNGEWKREIIKIQFHN